MALRSMGEGGAQAHGIKARLQVSGKVSVSWRYRDFLLRALNRIMFDVARAKEDSCLLLTRRRAYEQ